MLLSGKKQVVSYVNVPNNLALNPNIKDDVIDYELTDTPQTAAVNRQYYNVQPSGSTGNDKDQYEDLDEATRAKNPQPPVYERIHVQE